MDGITQSEPILRAKKVCAPCASRGRVTAATKAVNGEPFCAWCYAGFNGPHDPSIQTSSKKVPTTEPPDGGEAMSAGKYVNPEELRRLHGEGKSDQQIADAMGYQRLAIMRNRRKLGLAANFAPGEKVGQAEQPPRKESAPAAPPAMASDVTTVCLSERALNAIWHMLPIERKAELIELLTAES
jgi:hypothetical protein